MLAARLSWKQATFQRSSLQANSLYLIAASAVAAAFGFFFWTAAARLYTPQEVGLAAGAVSAIGLLAMLSVLGLDFAMIRFLPHAADPPEIINSALTIATITAFALCLAFAGGLGVWSPALLPLRQSPLAVTSLVIAVVFTALMAILQSVYLSRKQAKFTFAQSVVFSATKVLLAVIFGGFFHAMGLIGAWTLGLVIAVACGVGLFLPWLEDGHYKLRFMVRREAVNDMTHFAFANYVAMGLWSAPTFLLPLLVVNKVGLTANAYFYVASSVSGLLAMVPMAVSLSLFAHGSHDKGQLFEHTLQSGRLAALLLIPAIGAIFLFGGKVLLLFGKPYSEQATRLLWVLALSTLPMTANSLFFSVSRVLQRMGRVIAWTSWILGVTLVLSFLLLPRMGVLGCGVAWLSAHTSAATFILIRYARSRTVMRAN